MTLLYWEWHLIPRWYLRSIFARFPEQLLKGLVSLGSSSKCSMIDCFLGNAFGVMSCQFWSTVLQCGARLYQLLDRVVSSAHFLSGGVFQCDLTHRRSVLVLCMLYKIRCNAMHPLYGALLEPYVPVHVTLSVVIAHRYTNAPPRCKTSRYHRDFIHLSVSLWNNLVIPSSMVWEWLV